MKFDHLSLIDAHRPGGDGKTERYFFDYAINDRPLTEIAEPGDFIGVFGWLGREWDRRFFHRLLLRERSELPSGRVPLYICPECGDLGCGTVSVRITKYDDCFVWSDFGFENNYENRLVESYPHVRDFVFEKAQYYRALNQFGFE